MNFKSILYFFFIILFSQFSIAQVAINTDDSNPDASSILDIKSTDKGMLIPRMTTAQRTAISSPATGLLVFDNETNSFWFYDGNTWENLTTVSSFEYDTINKVLSPNTVVTDLANDDFVFGSTSLDDNGNASHDSRFFFDKSKSAFRVGLQQSPDWDENNVGMYSFGGGKNTSVFGDYAFAFGNNAAAGNNNSFSFGESTSTAGDFTFAFGYQSDADGDYSFAFGNQANSQNPNSVAFGEQTTAKGDYAFSFGLGGTAHSYGETVLGIYATDYTPTDNESFITTDRLFVIGNGTANGSRSDALVMLKNGNTMLNGALTLSNGTDNYTFPNDNGTNGQALITDGNGVTAWTTLTDNDNQALSISSDILSLTNGGTVDLSNYLDNTDAQAISISSDILSLTNGGTADLSSYLDNTDAQVISFSSDILSLTNGGTADLSSYLDNTDAQAISISSDILSLTNGGTVDLSSYLDNTDAQTISFSSDILSLTNGGTVDLSGYLDNTDAQVISISSDILSLTNGGTVDLSGYLDNTDAQAISISSDILSLTNGGTVDLSAYLDAPFKKDAGSNIIKPNSSIVSIVNNDFVFGSDTLDYDGDSDHNSRFFFDKSKGAFRAGLANSANWNESEIGNFSFSAGRNTIASGNNSMSLGFEAEATGGYSIAMGYQSIATGPSSVSIGTITTSAGESSMAFGEHTTAATHYSTAFGRYTTASGQFSTALGRQNEAFSYAEVVMGMYSTNYTPSSTYLFDGTDRLFTIGNGLGDANRSDALIILKSGNTTLNGNLGLNGILTINSAFSFPTADGTTGQILSTDGNGALAWTSLTDNDNQTLSLSSNTLNLTNGGSIDLEQYANSMIDADNNTKIQVEESANEDIIRFDLAGSERLRLRKNTYGRTMLEFPNNGNGNLFIGKNNGQYTDLTGENNAFVGSSAGLENTSGSGNSFFGAGTGYENTSGNDNTFIGRAAGYLSTTGDKNIFIGKESGYENFSGNNNIFIGYRAGYDEDGSNKLIIESSSSSSPLIYGEFNNDLLRINGTLDVHGDITTVDGTQSMKIKTNAASNYIQIDVEGTGHSADAIYIGDASSSTNEVYMLGNVGIGTNTPGYQLQVGNSGDGTTARANAWNTFSDRRLKRNFQKIENPIEKLNALNGYYYHWTADKKDQSRQLGVIAQEVEIVLPEIVKTDKEGIKSVDYSKLTAYLIEVNKVQQTEINQLKVDNEVLKTQMNRIDELESIVLEMKAEE